MFDTYSLVMRSLIMVNIRLSARALEFDVRIYEFQGQGHSC